MKKIKFQILLLVITILLSSFPQMVLAAQANNSTSQTVDMEYLRSVMDMIKEKYKGEITDRQLLEGALKGMFDSMDPYTTFFTPVEAERFFSEMQGSYAGIGIMVEKQQEYTIIAKVFSSSPAEKAGLLPNDKIVQVNGQSVVGQPIDAIVSQIKGEPNTTVVVGVIRGNSEIMKYTVTREIITVNPVSYSIKDQIGYIKLDIFNTNAYEAIQEALDVMDQNNVKKIVLDLRDNPGGDVNVAVNISSLFVPEGLITKLDFKSDEERDIEYYSPLKTLKYKMAVIVNGMSASASEILAGAIQDTKVGTIIGTQTFGKAKVQKMVPILTPEAYQKYQSLVGSKEASAYDLIAKYGVTPYEEEIIGETKMTVGIYTTPNGRMIDGVGLTPDLIVEETAKSSEFEARNIGKLTKTVKLGLNSVGADVYTAEKILNVLGYVIEKADTTLDAKTSTAIANFQKDMGIFSYGVLDFTTQQHLNNQLYKLILQTDKQYAKAIEVLNRN